MVDGTAYDVYGDKEGEAQRRLDDLKASLVRGTFTKPERRTVGRLLDEYVADGEARGLRPKTLFFYRQARDRYISDPLKRVRLHELRPEHVRRWQADLMARGLSATTVRNTRVLLNAALEFARRHEWIAVNPCERVRPPRRERPQLRPPTPAEMGRLLDAAEAAGDRLAALWALAAYTGCRPGELLALRWEDVDLDAGSVTVRRTLTKVKGQPVRFGAPKTEGGRRGLRIAPDAVAALRRHRAGQGTERDHLGPDYEDLGLVFCLETGDPLLPRHAARRFKQALERADLPAAIRFYDLRHGNATAMLLSGVAPKAAAERLGHSSTQLFHETYAHMLQELDADAAAKLQGVIRRSPKAG